MPIKNFWSLEPGEAMVAETMRRQLPGWEIFFPVKDIAVDLLAVREAGTSRGRMLTIQVKESKAYERRDRDVTPVDSVIGWFVLNPKKHGVQKPGLTSMCSSALTTNSPGLGKV